MKNKFLLFIILLFSAASTFACLNEFYATDRHGKLVYYGRDWKDPFHKNFNTAQNVSKLRQLEQKLKKEKNYMLLSDYSVYLMKLGKQKEALEILKELHKQYPKEYKIAANLGTAYELNGQPDSALKYIKLDLLLNPDDHMGSEWIHVKVLETKLKLQQNPDYLNDRSVLELTEKQKNDTLVLQHITIQLEERVPFSLGPDAIMASIFSDLGDISANVRSIEYARAYYLIAKKYYGSTSPLLDQKIKEMEKLIRKYGSGKILKSDPDNKAMREMVGLFDYKELLIDKSDPNYKQDRDTINTNVDSLLAFAGLTRTTEIVPPASIENAGTDSGIKKQEPLEKSHTWLYISAIIVAAGLGYLLIKKFR